MITDKKFKVLGSSDTFNLHHGLQQGTVSSPYLFKIYFSDIIKLFGINIVPLIEGDMFADDLNIRMADKSIEAI